MDSLTKLGIDYKDQRRAIEHISVSGATGSTFGFKLKVFRIKLGPIERFDGNYKVTVLPESSLPYPILGETFFEGWKVTIDYDHKRVFFQNIHSR